MTRHKEALGPFDFQKGAKSGRGEGLKELVPSPLAAFPELHSSQPQPGRFLPCPLGTLALPSQGQRQAQQTEAAGCTLGKVWPGHSPPVRQVPRLGPACSGPSPGPGQPKDGQGCVSRAGPRRRGRAPVRGRKESPLGGASRRGCSGRGWRGSCTGRGWGLASFPGPLEAEVNTHLLDECWRGRVPQTQGL